MRHHKMVRDILIVEATGPAGQGCHRRSLFIGSPLSTDADSRFDQVCVFAKVPGPSRDLSGARFHSRRHTQPFAYLRSESKHLFYLSRNRPARRRESGSAFHRGGRRVRHTGRPYCLFQRRPWRRCRKLDSANRSATLRCEAPHRAAATSALRRGGLPVDHLATYRVHGHV